MVPVNAGRYPVSALTGHRRLGDSTSWVCGVLVRTAAKLRDEYATTTAISGMALGADTMWADAALGAGLDLHAYVPFPQQADRWPARDQQRWRELLDHASEVHTIGDHYDVRYLFARNDAMLRDCDLLIAVWDATRTTGGTVDAVRKARRRGLPIIHLDPAAHTSRLIRP